MARWKCLDKTDVGRRLGGPCPGGHRSFGQTRTGFDRQIRISRCGPDGMMPSVNPVGCDPVAPSFVVCDNMKAQRESGGITEITSSTTTERKSGSLSLNPRWVRARQWGSRQANAGIDIPRLKTPAIRAFERPIPPGLPRLRPALGATCVTNVYKTGGWHFGGESARLHRSSGRHRRGGLLDHTRRWGPNRHL